MRDIGPTFVVKDDSRATPDDTVGLVDWKFNGWSKYPNHIQDNRVPRRMAKWLDLPRWQPRSSDLENHPRVVMEGGAIDVNGRGCLLATEECLLSEIQARNPQLDRLRLEQILGEYLAVRHVVWLGRGIEGDDTHGHVDDIRDSWDRVASLRLGNRVPLTRTTSHSRKTYADSRTPMTRMASDSA